MTKKKKPLVLNNKYILDIDFIVRIIDTFNIGH